ncbi:hypothetical protein ACFVT9_37600 [Kitasatospora cineracea]|uniref:hypothetical protein n=1 Tax=Kitasatospora cineracea TaxID=88074 RepID=UPI0036DEC9EA
MSRIITFFTAPSHEAASAVVETGPAGIFASQTWGNFDPEDAMVVWESFLTGRNLDELLDDGEPETVADPDEGRGSAVLVSSPALQKALADTDRSRLGQAGRHWMEQQASEGTAMDQETAEEILHSLADLARSARPGDRLYCWTT